MSEFHVFKGNGGARPEQKLPEPPPWRRFDSAQKRGETYQLSEHPEHTEVADVVNAAICLRRPLLVTGKPGVGKSSLAYRIAHELSLRDVLVWPVNTRSTIRDALYQYDAVGRLQQAALQQKRDPNGEPPDIGEYITLGPLGTALLPVDRPRVLLVDEIDKGEVDLPNDLLHVFEDGFFEIPELSRSLKDGGTTRVRTSDRKGDVAIGPTVQCKEFPIIVMTSNGERDFPAAFKRRCLPLTLQAPDEDQLACIVEAHFQKTPDKLAQAQALIKEFVNLRDGGTELATDQLLNSVALALRGVDVTGNKSLRDVIFAALTSKGGR